MQHILHEAHKDNSTHEQQKLQYHLPCASIETVADVLRIDNWIVLVTYNKIPTETMLILSGMP